MTFSERLGRIFESILAGLFGSIIIGIFFGSLIAAAIGFGAAIFSFNSFREEEDWRVMEKKREADRQLAFSQKRTRSRSKPLNL